MMPGEMNGTCYKGGLTVKENYQMCQVINRKIIDQLDPQVPEVTFSCHRKDSTCAFQCIVSILFWVNGSLG
jgi:ATP-binding cassette, subfamily G (WHITE), member 2